MVDELFSFGIEELNMFYMFKTARLIIKIYLPKGTVNAFNIPYFCNRNIIIEFCDLFTDNMFNQFNKKELIL